MASNYHAPGISAAHEPFPIEEWTNPWASKQNRTWQLNRELFDVGQTADLHLHRYVLIPDWSITIPLTLISFWLLTTKPRKSNQKKITEPISVEGK